MANHPRITLHLTPTSGSRLNLVEVFFGIITRPAIRTFIDGGNDRCHPFTWTRTADDILPRATRKRDSDAGH